MSWCKRNQCLCLVASQLYIYGSNEPAIGTGSLIDDVVKIFFSIEFPRFGNEFFLNDYLMISKGLCRRAAASRNVFIMVHPNPSYCSEMNHQITVPSYDIKLILLGGLGSCLFELVFIFCINSAFRLSVRQ